MNSRSDEDPLESAGDDIKLVDEKALNWFDVSAIGTGEMLFTAGWAWIIYIASLYGIKWTLVGFAMGVVLINLAWWLYREMITAVPEPGSIQSYGREAGLFPLGTTYFVLYAPIYGAYMWLELIVAQGLFRLMFPDVPEWVWPYVVLVPVVALNLRGMQITGKVQAALVTFTLVGDIFLACAIWWLMSDAATWQANWNSPTPITWFTPFTIAALWVGLMAAVLEVQQIMVDEWSDFERSRDVGLLSSAWQLWARQIPLALALLASLPIAALAVMPVPTVQAVQAKLGNGPVFYLALSSMLVATYSTFSVYFMAEGRVLALYAQQGALPRIFGRYSSRSVPWVAIVILALFALIGPYWKDFTFITEILTNWSSSLYLVIAIFYLRMRARKDLERPLTARWGVPIAIFLVVFAGMLTIASFLLNWKAGLSWFLLVGAFIFYDFYVVPRTERGGFYRAQVLRRRTSAARL